MPKILRIVNRFNLGGPTFSVANLTKHLDRFETKLIGGERDEFEESSEFILKDMEIEYSILSSMKREVNFKKDREAYKELKKIIAEFQPDIVHTHAAKAGAIGRLAAHKMNVPVIVHTFHGHVFHSYFGKLKTEFYKWIERYLARKSSAIVTLSKQQRKEICDIYKICPPEKAKVVPLGFNLDRFREDQDSKRKQFRSDWQIADHTIAIGLVGRVVPIKNHSLFLRSFKAAKETVDQKIQGVIIGDGDLMDSVQQEAINLGLTISTPQKVQMDADIIFTSWIKAIDVANAGLDIMALTSLNEGTPVSLIEAQASSLPVVSTDVGGVRDIVLDGETGYITPNADLGAFTKKLTQLIENNELRRSMGVKGQDFAFEKFYYLRFCEEMSNLYLELMNDLENNFKND